MDGLEKLDICDAVIPRPTYISVCLNTRQKTGNNRVVEGVHILFCLGIHQDAWVKQGAHRTSATD
jgi:hypothetical protein